MLSHVHIGLILDPAHAFRLVDHGPPASEQETEESTEFRDFWGPKAELRRFKDGRIQESVVWDVKSSDERTRIPFLITRHILEWHLGLDGDDNLQDLQKDFDAIIRLPERVSRVVHSSGVPAGFKGAMAAFDGFVRQLKELDEELPLALLNVSPVSEYLRYTSVFAPVPISTKTFEALRLGTRYLPSFEIILQFERSARWPDDLAAIQKMKLAFFERIASSLMNKVPGLVASVVLGKDSSTSQIADDSSLEVLTPEGWAFSTRIWHDREALLLERICGKKRPLIQNPTQTTGDGPAYKHALQELHMYTRRFIHAPKHHRAVAALSHHYAAYPGTVRLVKRWLASHWIAGGHVTDEAVELLCATVFLRSTTSDREGDEVPPGSPMTKEAGFFRMIAFLKGWSWESGIFVPLYEREESDAPEDSASRIKAGAGTGVWIISTAEDPEGRIWTRFGPSALVARRIKDLANATFGCCTALESGQLNPKVSTSKSRSQKQSQTSHIVTGAFLASDRRLRFPYPSRAGRGLPLAPECKFRLSEH